MFGATLNVSVTVERTLGTMYSRTCASSIWTTLVKIFSVPVDLLCYVLASVISTVQLLAGLITEQQPPLYVLQKACHHTKSPVPGHQ